MSIIVSTRFISFLLILILLPLRFSSGHAKQVKKLVVLATSGSGTATSSMHVEIYDGVPVVAELDQRTMLGPGRKMMTKGVSNEKRKLGDSARVKMPGFVSLNADYHVPRPHPPKNN
ncbi:hypothetical protein L6164_011287 [Bauhinia variegata]|uniref:Uncharacterized protein n=1 Tax=Bauhinia variegata TaxID=167791 RepID=A0ACB9P672_BAUVA|nr:hypothetical protein L6164_011287 [Bauhinia variegata]